MHAVARCHVAVVGCDKIFFNVVHSEEGRCICEVGSNCRNIGFDCMCDGVHACVSYELLRHSLGKLRIYDGDVRCDFEVSDRVLDICVCQIESTVNMISQYRYFTTDKLENIENILRSAEFTGIVFMDYLRQSA